MTPQTSTEMVHKSFEAVNRHDLDALMAFYRDDAVLEIVPPRVFRGKQAIRDYWAEGFASMPDLQLEVVSILDAGDRVAVEWRARGTFTGAPSEGIHATGKPFNIRGCLVTHSQDGLIAETTQYMDAMTWTRQIGALPAEGTLGDKAMAAAFNAQTDLVKAIREWREKRQHS